mmetsp:Transcript_13016/g.17911  ORF Transcript_13016/g.17911 Transcript_13016/m.17911 type:complete len:81 (-) Transcript_13016:180-422(-)
MPSLPTMLGITENLHPFIVHWIGQSLTEIVRAGLPVSLKCHAVVLSLPSVRRVPLVVDRNQRSYGLRIPQSQLCSAGSEH